MFRLPALGASLTLAPQLRTRRDVEDKAYLVTVSVPGLEPQELRSVPGIEDYTWSLSVAAFYRYVPELPRGAVHTMPALRLPEGVDELEARIRPWLAQDPVEEVFEPLRLAGTVRMGQPGVSTSLLVQEVEEVVLP